jgi:hypothetical protein
VLPADVRSWTVAGRFRDGRHVPTVQTRGRTRITLKG